jgi:hypothetical protein
MKKNYLNEKELIKAIKNKLSISESSYTKGFGGFPSEYTVEPHIPETPRERQIKGAFGSYGETVMDDAFRYLRKNPRQFFKKLWSIYGDKAYDYLDMASGKFEISEDDNDVAMVASEIDPDLGLAMMKEYDEEDEYEEDDYDPRQSLINSLKSKIEDDEDFDESDINDIYQDGKPFRKGRGSIYVDVLVPETDDREFDRKVANKMMEYYSKLVKDENYVGGVGFRNQGNLIKPYDKDF